MDDTPAERPERALTDPAAAALANARALARGRPSRRTRRRRAESDERPRRGGYSGPGPDSTDPQPVGAVLAGYVDDRGWQRPLNQARVFSDWAAIVGADVAAHCQPVSLRDGELSVRAQSTAWATQLRLLAGTLLARLADELGPGTVAKLVVTGPTGPSWKHGRFTVPGSRGPRDTYG